MLNNIFKIVYLILLFLASIIRASGVSKSKNWWKSKDKIAQDRNSCIDRILLGFVFLGMQAVPLLYVFSPYLDFADYKINQSVSMILGWTGALIFVSAIFILWKSHVDLGLNFSPKLQLRKEHSLVTTGVFKKIRHPMYTAHFLWSMAQVLLLQNWIAGWGFLITLLPLYLARIKEEEQMMLDEFGDQYCSYMRKTGRLLPKRLFYQSSFQMRKKTQ
jgi:protein-S-isoprenylcysteine O-methyltransferase Ste14